MKKKLFATIGVFLSLAAGVVIILVLKGKPGRQTAQDVTPTTTPTPVVMSTEIFALVAKFKTVQSDFSIQELEAQKIAAYTEYADAVPANLLDETITAADLAAKLDAGYFVVLPIDQVDAKYKTIKVAGQNIWAKDFDEQEYPFKRSVVADDGSAQTILVSSKKERYFVSGEVIPARAVDRLSLNVNNNYTYLFDHMRSDIEDADLAIAMLENSLLGDPKPCSGCTSFTGDDKVAQGLATVGFDLFSMAGNHAGDAGQKGYPNTIQKFSEAGIKVAGTGATIDDAIKPAIIEVGGKKIGLIGADDIAYFYWELGTDNSKFGTNTFSKRTNQGLLAVDQAKVEKIKTLKETNDLDYLAVYMSWGIEYTNKPTEHQRKLGRAIIDAGADIILGSHPHWVQSIEFYNEKPIIYSMGNFIFDQTHTLETRQAMTTNLYFYGGELKFMELMPIQMCGYHQTKNDLTQKYLAGEVTLEQFYTTPDNQGCIYWMPKKLKQDHPSYKQILERVFQYS